MCEMGSGERGEGGEVVRGWRSGERVEGGGETGEGDRGGGERMWIE